jgi:hypothetical protein
MLALFSWQVRKAGLGLGLILSLGRGDPIPSLAADLTGRVSNPVFSTQKNHSMR